MSARKFSNDCQRSQTLTPRPPYHFHLGCFAYRQRWSMLNQLLYVGVPRWRCPPLFPPVPVPGALIFPASAMLTQETERPAATAICCNVAPVSRSARICSRFIGASIARAASLPPSAVQRGQCRSARHQHVDLGRCNVDPDKLRHEPDNERGKSALDRSVLHFVTQPLEQLHLRVSSFVSIRASRSSASR